MGKKKQLKRLREAAKQLPAMEYTRMSGTKMRGSELSKDIVSNYDEDKTDPSGIYRVVRPEQVPLNHYKKMKQAYARGGMNTAGLYAKAVIDHVNKKIAQ